MSSDRFVSRGGEKLAAALDAFALDVAGLACADLGCSTGGFTDCLLQRGAARVFSVDTAYGVLDYKLRSDDRVTVLERTNAVHLDPRNPEPKPAKLLGDRFGAGVDLVVMDLGWTKQERAVPVALNWLRADAETQGPLPGVISLIKPHYESGEHRMSDDDAAAETQRVLDTMPAMGVEVRGCIESPIRGGKGKNPEWLALLKPVP